jgi:hypothetical protein
MINTPTLNGERYDVKFLDDCTRFLTTVLMNDRTAINVYNAFLIHEKRLRKAYEDQHIGKFDNVLQTFHSDNDQSFGKELKQYLLSKNIEHNFSIEYDHPQSGAIERANRTISDMDRSQRTSSNLPVELWGYSRLHATLIKNYSWQKGTTSDASAYELLTGVKPDLSTLKPFGTPAIVHIPFETRSKNVNHGTRCRYIGESPDYKGQIFIECSTNRIFVSRDADYFLDWKTNPTCKNGFDITFPEDHINEASDPEYFPTKPSNIDDNTIPTIETDPATNNHTPSENPSWTYQSKSIPAERDINSGPKNQSRRQPTPRANSAQPQATEWWNAHDDDDPIFDFDGYYAFNATCSPDIPSSLKAAMRSPDWPQWRQAMMVELIAHQKNQTWKILPRHQFFKNKKGKTIKCKWVYDKKFHHDGTLKKFKARLVARGFTQRHGVDYTETFAPTLALKSFRTLVALAAAHGLKLYQADVPTAFVRSDLEEEVLMDPPEIPSDLLHLLNNPTYFECDKDHLLLLNRALYGLKQSPRTWYKNIRTFLLSLGFVNSKADPCIFTLSQNGKFLVMGVYVDDLLYFGDPELIEIITSALKDKYNITEFGLASLFLGIRIDQSIDSQITLDQTAYISDFLDGIGFTNPNFIVSTPLAQDYSRKLASSTTDTNIQSPIGISYNEAVGKIMYAMVATRPDICAATGIASRFLQSPSNISWNIVMRILKYLNGTRTFGITYRINNQTLSDNTTPKVFADADYANCPTTSRSISGYLILLCNGPVVWYSKKQSTTAQSTAEAEFISANICARMVVWMRKFLADLSISQVNPTTIFEDNEACISLANNPQLNEKTAHIQVRYHYLQEVIHDNIISLQYINTSNQIADIFTKGLHRSQFIHLRSLLGVSNLRGSITPSSF